MATEDEFVSVATTEGQAEPGWSPGPGVVNHAGDPIGPDWDFFAPPPPEIGEVITAHTTLRRGKAPPSLGKRFALTFLPGFAAIGLLQYAGYDDVLIQVGAFVVLFLIGAYFARFAHRCSYVGAGGVARYWCRGHRGRIKKSEVFLFRDAAALKTSQTRHYHNGVYSGTQYAFRWRDAADRHVYKLSGTYYSEKKPPKPKDPFHLASSAERAWSLHLLGRAQDELAARGAIRFSLGGSDWVDVGPGFVEFQRKGKVERWGAEEIGAISARDGSLKVQRRDAQVGWFNSTGVLQFPVSSMANAQLFLILLNRFLAPGGATPPT
jgi:hypothetical protein